MMIEALKSFAMQLSFEPQIINAEKLIRDQQLVVCGMGGSHLSADTYALLSPLNIRAIHSDYGLPDLVDEVARRCTYVMSSYSGNTEEILESYDAARTRGFAMCAMAVGGKLIERASADGIPYIQFPNLGLQPRAALGFGCVALAHFAADAAAILELKKLSTALAWESHDAAGTQLAAQLHGKTPIIYATRRNAAIAQNWKIKCNENAKIPAFWNIIPELNHNEITGFDAVDATRALSQQFFVILLRDDDDHPNNLRRMDATQKMYEARGIGVITVAMTGTTRAEKIFNSLMRADWSSVRLGERYGVETEQVPMVEEFKKLIAPR